MLGFIIITSMCIELLQGGSCTWGEWATTPNCAWQNHKCKLVLSKYCIEKSNPDLKCIKPFHALMDCYGNRTQVKHFYGDSLNQTCEDECPMYYTWTAWSNWNSDFNTKPQCLRSETRRRSCTIKNAIYEDVAKETVNFFPRYPGPVGCGKGHNNSDYNCLEQRREENSDTPKTKSNLTWYVSVIAGIVLLISIVYFGVKSKKRREGAARSPGSTPMQEINSEQPPYNPQFVGPGYPNGSPDKLGDKHESHVPLNDTCDTQEDSPPSYDAVVVGGCNYDVA